MHRKLKLISQCNKLSLPQLNQYFEEYLRHERKKLFSNKTSFGLQQGRRFGCCEIVNIIKTESQLFIF